MESKLDKQPSSSVRVKICCRLVAKSIPMDYSLGFPGGSVVKNLLAKQEP